MKRVPVPQRFKDIAAAMGLGTAYCIKAYILPIFRREPDTFSFAERVYLTGRFKSKQQEPSQ
jgi:hypothetical protein